jgi:hypothetical protein
MKKLARRRQVSWEDPMVGAALALDLSGLDYLRATTTCLAFEPHRQSQSGGNGSGR